MDPYPPEPDLRPDAAAWAGGPVERLAALVDRLRRDRMVGGILLSALLAVALAGYAGFRWLQPPEPPRAEDVLPRVATSVTSAPAPTVAPLVVHVVGAVHDPGVRSLDPSSRVIDAVAAAGGATADADLRHLNLAAPVIDGSQIRVPVVGEEVTGALVVPPAGPDGAGTPPGPVELNTADLAALETLPGVGPATAAAIVAWREAHGPFRAVEQLLEVRGIGPAKFEALEPLVVVR